ASFLQKKHEYSLSPMSLNDFLQKVSAKCFGKIWVDIDFCFLENSIGELDAKEIKAVMLVNRSLDFIFKSLLFYDDVTDFDEDFNNDIINSTMILGIDLGKLAVKELFEAKGHLYTKLEERGIIDDAVAMGNILYTKGINCLMEAKEYTQIMDADALTFCAKVLRLFLMRKTLPKGAGLNAKTILKSLESFTKVKTSIPEYLKSYERTEVWNTNQCKI
ncbi:MAG: hypothetical protein ABIH76_04190, partial [Candidatus Bathyarchaeota archaeon]